MRSDVQLIHFPLSAPFHFGELLAHVVQFFLEGFEPMAHIAKDLETKDYGRIVKDQNPHQIEFLRRKESDLLFQYGASESKFPITVDLQTQTKRILKDLESHIAQEREHVKQADIAL